MHAGRQGFDEIVVPEKFFGKHTEKRIGRNA